MCDSVAWGLVIVCLKVRFFFFFFNKKVDFSSVRSWLLVALAHTARHQAHCSCVWTLVPYSLISIKAVSIGTNYCSILTTKCGVSFGLATEKKKKTPKKPRNKNPWNDWELQLESSRWEPVDGTEGWKPKKSPKINDTSTAPRMCQPLWYLLLCCSFVCVRARWCVISAFSGY